MEAAAGFDPVAMREMLNWTYPAIVKHACMNEARQHAEIEYNKSKRPENSGRVV